MRRAARVQRNALNILGQSLAKKIQEDGSIPAAQFNVIQPQGMDLARFLAEAEAMAALVDYAEKESAGEFERHLTILYVSESIIQLARHVQYSYQDFGLHSTAPLEELFEMASHLKLHNHSADWSHLGGLILDRERDLSGDPAIDEMHKELRDVFARFSDDVIAPIAEQTHREDKRVSDDVLKQLAELGVFGISIPAEFGGSFLDHLVMMIATEELSRGSLGAGGSVLTRPEICAKALLAGATEEQKNKWLPKIASGETMVCVAVTEPNTGSDVASVKVTATPVDGGYLINGEKTWVTFAGRSNVFCLLARTGSPESGHKGLSLFLVEKEYNPGENEYHFRHLQSGGGVVEGRAIPTIGYRGMHSYSVSFENYFVPAENRIGDEGRGFYLQMQGFAGGRIQTAARALGVMEAAFRSAASYTKSRKIFGQPLANFALTTNKLAHMAARIQASRQLAYKVATMMDVNEGGIEASLVKLLACKDAEWVTREAMQLHGGMGYSEEYAVSRYFLDARVLSIFEGAEEVLALQVIVRPFLQQFLKPA